MWAAPDAARRPAEQGDAWEIDVVGLLSLPGSERCRRSAMT
jgi:hypothetical protein